nr:hypothetical protein CFP56_52220 [Quercus suber]
MTGTRSESDHRRNNASTAETWGEKAEFSSIAAATTGFFSREISHKLPTDGELQKLVPSCTTSRDGRVLPYSVHNPTSLNSG